MASFRLTLLGGFQARIATGSAVALPTKKAQALLAYLALPAGRAHPRDKLATLLWGDSPEGPARASLRQALFALRRVLPADAVRVEGDHVALDPTATEVDVAAFEAGIAEGTPSALAAAAPLYRGDLLAGLSVEGTGGFEEWLLGERERLRELALEAPAKLLAHQRATGATDAGIQTALTLLALDPLQEPVHRTLMRLYAEAGRRGAALRQYQACVTVLGRELGIEPESDTKQLYQELLDDRPIRQARSKRPAPALHRPFRMPALETPLLGRDVEWARLLDLLDTTTRGQGRVVFVLGEAGIGKTRLVEELQREGHARRHRILLAHCHESEQILPFGPWTEALRSTPLDEHVLAGLGPAWRSELARLLPEVAIPGLPAPTQDTRRLFEGVGSLLGHLAVEQPVVVVLEDVHWADEMSLRLLAFVARRAPAMRLLLVATAREEELESAAPLTRVLQELVSEPLAIALSLGRLSEQDTLGLIRAIGRVGRDEVATARLAARLWAAAEGNPFVIVEILRALEQQSTPGTPDALPIPGRVRDVVAGRLDRLETRAQAAVGVAAVIGREFDFALLQRASELPPEDAAAAIEELVRRRILHAVGDALGFTHERVRQVVLSRLLPPRRQLLHGTIAASIEALHADDLEPHWTTLGTHYRDSQTWDRAARYLYLAGVRAIGYGAFREAMQLLEAAVDANERQGERCDPVLALDTLLELWVPYFECSEFVRLRQLFPKAERFALAVDDPGRLARLRLREAQACWVVSSGPGMLEAAISRAAEAAGLAAPGDLRTQSYARFVWGAALRDLGRFREAIGRFEEARALFGEPARAEHGDPLLLPIYVSLSAWRAESHAQLGEFDRALACAADAVRVAERIAHPPSRILAAGFLGYVSILGGRVEAAVSVLEAALAMAEEIDLAREIVRAGFLLAYARLLLGQDDRAREPLARAESAHAAAGFFMRQSTFGGVVPASVYLAAGRLDAARAEMDRALAAATGHDARGYLPALARVRAAVMCAATADDPEVQPMWQHGLELATALGMHPESARCRLDLGRWRRGRGDEAGGRRDLEEALCAFIEMDMPYWREQAATELERRA
jgi:DNA-binding SARP family transcriptional activator/tetratricopeptide (TPR) repeat protein